MPSLYLHDLAVNDVFEPGVGGSVSPSKVDAAGDPATGSDRTALLEGLFERILDVKTVTADDDFFELGGDSILAMTLILEIEAVTGVNLPMTAPFAASTPRALAAFMCPHGRSVAGEPELMKPGTAALPLFILPGASGTILELRDFVARLDTARAVYGLEAAGLHRGREPHDCIEDMATYQLAAIRRVQPSGPYLLAGYSMGGLVAYEMARRLTQAGESVVLVGLIDTVFPRRHIPWQARMGVVCRRAAHHLRATLRMPPLTAAAYLGRSVRNAFKDRPSSPPELRRPPSETPARDRPRAVFDAAVVAARNYRPGRYDGSVALLWARDDAPYSNLDIAWRCRARALTARLISGDHMTCVADAAGDLSAVLSAAEPGAPPSTAKIPNPLQKLKE